MSRKNVQKHNDFIRKFQLIDGAFERNWSWLIKEKRDLQEKLIKERNISIEIEKRSIRPIPQTTNGMYGHLSTRKEFQLEFDDCKEKNAMPLPDIYKLQWDKTDFLL